MKAKKIIIIVGVVVLALAIVGFSVNQTQKNVVAVQTGKVVKQDISSYVTASGEVKPKTFVNVGANAMGRIVRLMVKEGDHVKKGQVVAQLENVQSGADVAAMRATLQSNQTDAVAAEAALKTDQAALKSSIADEGRAKLEYDRAQSLYSDRLIPKADYDSKKAAWEVASALVSQNQARVSQAKAQLDSAQGHIGQARASLTRDREVFNKTNYVAPCDGVITNIPARLGKKVEWGIGTTPGSTMKTFADLDVI